MEIAKQAGARIVLHEWRPIVEEIWCDVVPKGDSKWVVFLDPDEVIQPKAADLILDAINATTDLISISVPWVFHYRGKPLKGTTWGGIRYKTIVFKRSHLILTNRVHGGKQVDGTGVQVKLPFDYQNSILHYWIDSKDQLIEKHLRYMQKEGKARYEEGERFSLKVLFYQTARAFYMSFFHKRAWLDGFTGVYLSLFYTWYVFNRYIELWKYEKSLRFNQRTE